MTSKKGHQSKVEELKQALEKRREMEGQKQPKAEAEAKAEVEKDDLHELTEGLRAAEEEAKAHYDKMLRVMAELDNFKKRSEREKQEMIKYSNEKLITDLLTVLDDLERVLEHVPEGASKELSDFVDGVQLVQKHFVKILGQYGLEEIKTEGEVFDPKYHEAVAHILSDNVKADHIIDVHRKGYILNDRVIRAAMAGVSKGKE